MYVALPFPRCKNCGKSAKQGYHHTCGGALEINPTTRMVHCPTCDCNDWNIEDSKYVCSCGAVFDSSDIPEAVEEMLLLCKVCMKELQKKQEAERKRETLCKESLRTFVNSFCERLGYYAGVAVETVISTLIKLIF